MLLEQAIPTIAREIELLLCDAALNCVQKRSKLVQDKNSFQASVELLEQQTLVSLVGHDLRLPLTAIKGYAGLLQAYGTTNTAIASTQADIAPDLQRHYLNVIMEQTQHMEVLVNDLLDVSRIQHGQVALHFAWVDIVSLCRYMVQMMQDRVDQQDEGRYYIRFSPDAQTTLLWTDSDRVRQVLTNLIENAIKYSPDGGLIDVTVRSYRRSSSIIVRDWGIGIPHSQQTALFHLFERGTQREQRAITGLGLGLYIARTLVEAMNGSLTVSSSEGQGTSVSFTLPRSSLAETTKSQGISSEMYSSC
jgi:signal transduction histidine kinase